MIDLHTHSLLSDGELIPSELVNRAIAAGYRAVAITDHVDDSNIDFVVPRILEVVRKSKGLPIDVIAGAEITHVPPGIIKDLVKEARSLGASLVIVHGETIVEPVPPGTNWAAIEAGADIIAHPGLIMPEEVKAAKERGVVLEITARKGHCLANGHVAKLALEAGATLVINTDSHSPSDFITAEMAKKILIASGIGPGEIKEIFLNSERIVKKALRRGNA